MNLKKDEAFPETEDYSNNNLQQLPKEEEDSHRIRFMSA
jgi:hypothetical protein